MARQIVCTNDDNVSISLSDSFSPFILISAEGLYEVNNNLYVSDNTAIDGATYQGSVAIKRNIVLTLRDKSGSDHQVNRELLYAVFKPASKGTLLYTDGVISREIGYYVESVHVDSESRARTATISLICPDPFFEAVADITVSMAGWNPLFEFPFEITSSGIVFEERVNELLKTITNESASERIGLTIILEAIGPVTNPIIEHVQKAQHIALGSMTYPFEMVSGDVVTITTADGNKHVYLTHNGTTEDVNQYMTEESEYLQLQRGANSIGYSADSGSANLMVTISYRYKYLGV